MVTHLLDTDVCIDFLRGKAPRLAERIRSHEPTDLGLSVITEAELHRGALGSADPAEGLAVLKELTDTFSVLPFDSPCVPRYAQTRLDLDSCGTPIGPNDLLIAATALAHDLTLVTHNTKEFSRVLGLRVEDWER